MSKNNDDFQFKVYEKFTELFVSQNGISDSLINVNCKVEDLALCISNLHLKFDNKIEEIEKEVIEAKRTIIIQHALISSSVKVASTTFFILLLGSFFSFREVFDEVADKVYKFI